MARSYRLGFVTWKWNESGFRPPLCTYRLNWVRRTSWGWWNDWDDTVLQTQYSKFEPWRSEAEHATSRSRRLPTILTFTRGWGRNNFVSFKPPRPGTEPRTLAWKAAVLTTTLGPPPFVTWRYQARSPVGPDICHRGWAYTVFQTVQRHVVYSAVYGTVHYEEPLKSFEIGVGHSPGVGLHSVAILP